MPRFIHLRVWHEARTLLRNVAQIRDRRGNGDLVSQLRRAALSVVSNISEGTERESNRDCVRFLVIARASCAEAHAQILIAGDLGLIGDPMCRDLVDRADDVGRMLTKPIDVRSRWG